ncbi:MAG: hypothetical protein ACI8PP_003124 [Candidatus Pseudothioglobus sp.]|jgi:hypothetical protein
MAETLACTSAVAQLMLRQTPRFLLDFNNSRRNLIIPRYPLSGLHDSMVL